MNAPVPHARARPGLNLEQFLYLLISLMATGIRLVNLGARPLNPEEAACALGAWRILQGQHTVNPRLSPVYVALSTLFFTLFGASDFTARLPAALTGGVLPLAFYPLRRALGRREALIAALLAAFSPLWIFASRTINGDIIVALAVLAAWGAWLAYREDRNPRWLYVAAGTAGVALASGPTAYTYATAGLTVLALARFRPLARSAEREKLPQAITALAGGFFLSSTALLFHPAGLGQAAEQVAVWGQGLIGADLSTRLLPLLTLLLYEPLLLLLAVMGAISVRNGETRAILASLEATFAAVAMAVQVLTGASGPGATLPFLLPLTILAAVGAIRAWDFLRKQSSLFAAFETGLVLSVSVYAYLTLAGYSQFGMQLFGALALVSIGALTSIFAALYVWRGFGEAARVALTWALVVALLWSVHLGWALSFGPVLHQRHLPLREFTSPEVRDVMASLHRLSSYRTGDPDTLGVAVVGGSPVLRWYVLRGFPNAEALETLPRQVDAGAVLTPAQGTFPLGEEYRGRDFTLTVRWHPTSLRGRELLRWLMFRDAQGAVDEKRAVLWVRGR